MEDVALGHFDLVEPIRGHHLAQDDDPGDDYRRAAGLDFRYGESLLLGGDKAGCATLQDVRTRYARGRAGSLARDLMAQHCP